MTIAKPICYILQDTLLTPHLRHIIDVPSSGLDFMIDADKIDDFSRLYRLFSIVPNGLPCLRRTIKELVIRRGKEFNNSTLGKMDDADRGEDRAVAQATTGAQSRVLALKWVEDVLQLKDKLDVVWKDCFKVDHEIESCLNEVRVLPTLCDGSILTPVQGFRVIHQAPAARTGIRLTLHRRESQERTQRGQPEFSHPMTCSLTGFFTHCQKADIAVGSVLDKMITVFRSITRKDIFQWYYWRHLAERLLLGHPVPIDIERGILAKFKDCSVEFNLNTKSMLDDMEISAVATRGWQDQLIINQMILYNRKHREERKQLRTPRLPMLPTELSVKVMTRNYWPVAYPTHSYRLPPELDCARKVFEWLYRHIDASTLR